MQREFTTSGFDFFIVLSVFFLIIFPVYPVEGEPGFPVAMPGEPESHFLFRTGVFFLMTKNIPDSAVIYLHAAKVAGDLKNNVNDSVNYYLSECYLALANLEAALETNLSISDSSDINAKVLFQRYRIFAAYGMDDDALNLIQLIQILYPDSEEAASWRSSSQTENYTNDPEALKLGMLLTLGERNTSRNFEPGGISDLNRQNLGKFGSQEWKTSIKATFLLNFNISALHSIDIRPWLKLSAPTQAFKDRYHNIALDINYTITPSEDTFHELTFTYTDKIQSGTVPSHEFSLGWGFTHIGTTFKTFSNNISASYLFSENNENNSYYFSILLSRLPVVSFGSRSRLNGWFLGMYSSIESINSNIPAFRVYGDGAVHDSTVGSSILYTDSTFTDSEKMDIYRMVTQYAHRLEGRVFGDYFPAGLATGTFGLDFTFSPVKWFSLYLEGQYETGFYVETYRFDNTHNSNIHDDREDIYLFLNRSDSREYLIYKQPKNKFSDPDIFRFKKYERIKKRRWDTMFLIRPGIDINPGNWMLIKMYAGFAWNVISFIGDKKHSYTNYEFMPGFECTFRF